ncbi:hypothetical protein FHT44_005145 [Mycolicibacterium sp. BK634]|uniref:hypothetical protein n=1 Tax=Mycolicibacterium sp. BK634 TaxID=2587099 RepID=UPI00161EEBC0|nr:hypothetical protein [Mycolicibacterium sp. BK634]MBB3752633.1 hypothetical protein [Mycolicibacterium sp. BK634]
MAFVCYYIVKFVSLSSETVTKALGGLGKHWRESADRKRPARQAEVEDLRAEVKALSKRLDIFRTRESIYLEYIIYDTDYHFNERLRLTGTAFMPTAHKSFPDFQKEWLNRNHMDMTDITL